jgi:tetratricopeptide (TPR) repeat protein
MARYEEAIKCFNETTIIQPDLIEATIHKGRLFNQLERYDEAINCLSQVEGKVDQYTPNQYQYTVRALTKAMPFIV